MITLEQAIKLATKAHKDQWRKPSTVVSDIWYGYKQQTEFIHENGNKIVWCNGNTFLEYEPYITHPLAVMGLMSTEEEKIVAVLHDIIEDTEAFKAVCDEQGHILVYNKKSYSITLKVYEALGLLTYNKSLSYDKYIKYISYNKLATKVKIADIIHNLSCSPSDNAKQKYLKAIPVLLKSL